MYAVTEINPSDVLVHKSDWKLVRYPSDMIFRPRWGKGQYVFFTIESTKYSDDEIVKTCRNFWDYSMFVNWYLTYNPDNIAYLFFAPCVIDGINQVAVEIGVTA